MSDTNTRLMAHYEEAQQLVSGDRIVGLFLQGSQNYSLDIPGSDVDSKLVIVPSFKEIAMNLKPVSTTHIRENDEHIDLKDVRLYMKTFCSQNLNFLEILFTQYKILNPEYEKQWNRLVEARERISHMNPQRAIRSFRGMAEEKFFAMEHRYPSRAKIIDKYGYDPKQLHHLRRVADIQDRYILGESYEDCLNPKEFRDELIDTKLGKYDLDTARAIAQETIDHVRSVATTFCEVVPNKEDEEVNELLDDVQYEVMRIAVRKELKL